MQAPLPPVFTQGWIASGNNLSPGLLTHLLLGSYYRGLLKVFPVTVTLLIPTFNRVSYLTNQLDYLARYFDRSSYNIFILDGSNNAPDRNSNERLARAHCAEYCWHDTSIVSGYERTVDGLRQITTPFVQVVPDDDFFSEAAIREHVAIMESTPDATGVYGHAISFQIRSSGNDAENYAQLRLNRSQNSLDYTFDHPLQRIFYSIFEKSRPAHYCLYRRDVLLRATLAALECSVVPEAAGQAEGETLLDSRCYYLGDLAITIMSLILGKKINSGSPAIAFQFGQSFDSGQNAKKNKVPERVPHQRLLLDPSYNFPLRMKLFVDRMVEEYTSEDANADVQAAKLFFENITLAFFAFCPESSDRFSVRAIVRLRAKCKKEQGPGTGSSPAPTLGPIL